MDAFHELDCCELFDAYDYWGPPAGAGRREAGHAEGQRGSAERLGTGAPPAHEVHG